ncbi:MAG: hypothetical protein JSU86_14750 [Phycisphaerales bacterium]|nr:MAG: hypothetical protein JSU86_14750 [Phycisphaerales bacterium]
MAYGLAASKRSIRELIGYCTGGRPPDRADVGLLNGWRGRTVGAMLEELLAGRRAIRVESLQGERLIRLVSFDDGPAT